MDTYSFCENDRIAQGNTAEIYRLGGGKILKLFRDGIAHSAIEREYMSSRIAARKLTEVPAIYDLLEHDGRTGIVFQEVNGDDMTRLLLVHPMKFRKYIKDFAAYHAKINTPAADDMTVGGMRTVVEKLRDEVGWENDLSDDEKKKVLGNLSDVRFLMRLNNNDFQQIIRLVCLRRFKFDFFEPDAVTVVECSFVSQLHDIRNGERTTTEQGMICRVELRENLFEVLAVNIGIEYIIVFIRVDRPVLIV